jgi:hypothetical protein
MPEHFYDEEDARRYFLQYGFPENSPGRELTGAEIREGIAKLLLIMQLPDFLSAFPASVYNREVMDHLAVLLWNALTTTLRMDLVQRKIVPVDQRRLRKQRNIKASLLGAYGRYPNVELHLGTSHYAFRSGVPLLITQDDSSSWDSEVSFLNAQELKLSAAIALSPESRGFAFHFDGQSGLLISESAFVDLPLRSVIDLVYELLLLRAGRVTPLGGSVPPVNGAVFHFAPFEADSSALQAVFNSIDVKDELLMRTLFFLVKSRMLWANPCFGEDAIANVMFCLEGTLLLLQRRQGLSDEKIDIKALGGIFKATFDRGEELFEFVKEGYDKRISIVHPSPAEGPKWMPQLLADDFYEYFDVARMLLIYLGSGIKVSLD